MTNHTVPLTTDNSPQPPTGQPTKQDLADIFRPDPDAVARAVAAGERPRKALPSDPLIILDWKMGGVPKKPNYFAVCQVGGWWRCRAPLCALG